jgi:hypothetical protein
MIASLVPHCPREILIEISNHLNAKYDKLKTPILNNLMKDEPVRKRELVWKHVTKKILDVMYPLIQATNTDQSSLLPTAQSQVYNTVRLNHQPLACAIKAYTQRHSIYWPKPLEINFLQIKDADDVATISCRVGDEIIPYAMIDSGSDSSIISENIANLLRQEINRKKIHRLNGVASKSQSLGTINNIPVTIEDGVDSLTISDEFSVVPTEYDDSGKELSLFILGTQWQYRAGWEPLVKGEFKATRNGKTITIPLSVHKSQRNVFTVGKEKKS